MKEQSLTQMKLGPLISVNSWSLKFMKHLVLSSLLNWITFSFPLSKRFPKQSGTLLQGYGNSDNHRIDGVKWQDEHNAEGGNLVFSHHQSLGVTLSVTFVMPLCYNFPFPSSILPPILFFLLSLPFCLPISLTLSFPHLFSPPFSSLNWGLTPSPNSC